MTPQGASKGKGAEVLPACPGPPPLIQPALPQWPSSPPLTGGARLTLPPSGPRPA